MEIAHLYPEPHAQTAGRVIDGEAVLILSDANEINVLNAVGSRIFELADGRHSLADIVDAIVSEYNVPVSEATEDVTRFITQLVAQNVLTLQPRQAE